MQRRTSEEALVSMIKRVVGKPILERVKDIDATSMFCFWSTGASVQFERGQSNHRVAVTLTPQLDGAVRGAIAYLTSRPSDDPHLVAAMNSEWPRLRAEVEALLARELRSLLGAACDLLSEEDVVLAHRQGQCRQVLES